MVAGISNDIYAREEGNRGEHGMRTVQQGNLTLMIRLLALGDEHVQTRFLGWELLAQRLDTHVLRLLNHPEMEGLGLYYQVVFVSYFLLNISYFLTWEAWYDTVNQGSANVVVLGEPLLERLIVFAQILFPQFDILVDTFLQVVSVEEDQLAGHDNQTFSGVSIEGLETTVEQLHQLTRIAAGRLVRELASIIKGDTGLCGVRDYKANLRLLGQCHEGCVLRVGVQCPADNIDAFEGVHGLTVDSSLQVHMVQAVLPVQPIYHSFLYWLHHHDTSVEVRLRIHVPDNPIYKGAKEIPFAKLNDLLRHHALRRGMFV